MALLPARPASILPLPPVARRLRALAAAAIASTLLTFAGLPAAAEDTVTLNFVNADIEAVVKAVGEITGLNFIIDPKVKGTVNIVSARPVPKSLVYPTLLSALRLQGVAAVDSGGVIKLVPEVDARMQGGPVVRSTGGIAGDRLVTQVITLRYESATQLVNVLRPLITPNNTIAAYPGSNALVITDYAENLKRLERIVATLDQPPQGEPVLVPVKNASAIDLVTTLNRLLNEGNTTQPGDGQRVLLVADPRSNSILIRADNPGRAARARTLIEQLDTQGRPGGNIFVIYLRNSEAMKVAQTLRSVLTGQDSGAQTTSPGLSPLPANATNIGGTTPAAGAQQMAAPLPFTPAANTAAFSAGGATIAADVAANALIIMAPEPVYNNLRAIVDKIDVRRAQVYVEALIVEVAADKAAELGIQWQALTGYNTTQTRVIGGTNFGARGSGNNIIDVAINPANAGQGLNLGVMRGTVSIPGLGVITNLAFLARALETQINANILSTPNLLTLDNEEARIMVGQNVPFITGQYAQTGSTTTVTPFQTIERRDVGLLLRVRPQITEGGTVRLVIYQEISRIEENTAQGIILQKRSLESSVIIDDTNIVVLGGLIQDQLTDGSDKVPVAGDIPIVGQLFRYDARKRVRTNLMVFLKPTIVRSSSDGRAITSERYDFLMGQQQQQKIEPAEERFFWMDPKQPPTLPPEGTMPGTPGTAPEPMPSPWAPSPAIPTPAPPPK
jgi:general secretion pathway protein D